MPTASAPAGDATPAEPLTPETLQDVAATFGLLVATVRLHIMWLLAAGERDVGSLARQVGQSVPTVSHHLGKLKLAGLVRHQRAGKRKIYFIDAPTVVDLIQLAIAHHQQTRQTAPTQEPDPGGETRTALTRGRRVRPCLW